jgi:hypothetical protein
MFHYYSSSSFDGVGAVDKKADAAHPAALSTPPTKNKWAVKPIAKTKRQYTPEKGYTAFDYLRMPSFSIIAL